MQKVQPRWDLRRRIFEGKVLTVVVGLFMAGTLAALVFSVWQKSTTPSQTGDYEGVIIDRWADYVESKYGSVPRLRLLVESQDGTLFPVKVDPNVYESAKIGMRIKSKSGQVVLIESPQPSGAK